MLSMNPSNNDHPPTDALTSPQKEDSASHKPSLENTPTLSGEASEEITGHEPTLEMPHAVRSRSSPRA